MLICLNFAIEYVSYLIWSGVISSFKHLYCNFVNKEHCRIATLVIASIFSDKVHRSPSNSLLGGSENQARFLWPFSKEHPRVLESFD